MIKTKTSFNTIETGLERNTLIEKSNQLIFKSYYHLTNPVIEHKKTLQFNMLSQ